jgi:hypothetical protein
MEINTFSLVSGVSLDEFLRANRCVDAWLRRQPGFRSRQIAQQADGTLIDVMIWANAEAGIDAMHRLLDELGDARVHHLVDQRTARWTLADVVLGMAAAGRRTSASTLRRRDRSRRLRSVAIGDTAAGLQDQV